MGSDGVGHPVVALVGRIDLRAVSAVETACRLDAGPVRALHVIEPNEDIGDLAEQWMAQRCSDVPLHTVEVAGSVPQTVVDVLASNLRHPSARLTVVIGRLDLARPAARWLHDHTSDAIAQRLANLQRLEVTYVDVRVAY